MQLFIKLILNIIRAETHGDAYADLAAEIPQHGHLGAGPGPVLQVQHGPQNDRGEQTGRPANRQASRRVSFFNNYKNNHMSGICHI